MKQNEALKVYKVKKVSEIDQTSCEIIDELGPK